MMFSIHVGLEGSLSTQKSAMTSLLALVDEQLYRGKITYIFILKKSRSFDKANITY